MALRVIRLVIPSGAAAFRSVNITQKVRTTKQAEPNSFLPRKLLKVYKDMLTLLVSFLASSITLGHQHATF